MRKVFVGLVLLAAGGCRFRAAEVSDGWSLSYIRPPVVNLPTVVSSAGAGVGLTSLASVPMGQTGVSLPAISGSSGCAPAGLQLAGGPTPAAIDPCIVLEILRRLDRLEGRLGQASSAPEKMPPGRPQ
jgi:hypothetical protein